MYSQSFTKQASECIKAYEKLIYESSLAISVLFPLIPSVFLNFGKNYSDLCPHQCKTSFFSTCILMGCLLNRVVGIRVSLKQFKVRVHCWSYIKWSCVHVKCGNNIYWPLSVLKKYNYGKVNYIF